MNTHGGGMQSPAEGNEGNEGNCSSAQSLLRDLWVNGDLDDLPLQSSPQGDDASGAPRRSRIGRGAPPRSRRGGFADTAVRRHIDACPSCRREADELSRLGQSLRVGLESLCGAIAETMDQDIEGTLRKLREDTGHAKFLHLLRRPLRLVLWISFLAFTLLASIGLAVAMFQALRGL